MIYRGLVVNVFLRLCSRWQDFDWQSASRGPSALAELLLKSRRNMANRIINDGCHSRLVKADQAFYAASTGCSLIGPHSAQIDKRLELIESVPHGQCDARPTVTFPVVCSVVSCLTGISLYYTGWQKLVCDNTLSLVTYKRDGWESNPPWRNKNGQRKNAWYLQNYQWWAPVAK